MLVSSPLKDLLLYALFLFLIYLFFFGNEDMVASFKFVFGEEWKSVFIAFLNMLLEALPFIILGAIFSSFIQLFVGEQTVQRLIPKSPLSAMIVALFIAVITPVCECAIIPVVKRLIQKGVPVHAGVVILVGAPILNFVVFTSTYYAFPNQPEIYFGRFILCMVTALVAGSIIYIFFSKSEVLKIRKEDLLSKGFSISNEKGTSKWKAIIHHTSHEFFQVGKYFIIGAFLASLAQIYIERSVLAQAVTNSVTDTMLMMGLAFLLSICSEADAFVAASFNGIFQPEAVLGFLVYGPILDLKNFLVMFSYYRMRFILFYTIVVTITIFGLSIFMGQYISMEG
ncbi:permease [Bacillus sp. V3-13]|uniref:permease n=1 Tax=Bacillus sp. V3-13 TaxID=2053728 RepID=UPI000C777950|nr:permease [Bacillus sp. V3-13]PLR75599.1 permease [Bacillus sp. V3-13]